MHTHCVRLPFVGAVDTGGWGWRPGCASSTWGGPPCPVVGTASVCLCADSHSTLLGKEYLHQSDLGPTCPATVRAALAAALKTQEARRGWGLGGPCWLLALAQLDPSRPLWPAHPHCCPAHLGVQFPCSQTGWVLSSPQTLELLGPALDPGGAFSVSLCTWGGGWAATVSVVVAQLSTWSSALA